MSQTEGETLVPLYTQDVFWGRLERNPVCHILPLRQWTGQTETTDSWPPMEPSSSNGHKAVMDDSQRVGVGPSRQRAGHSSGSTDQAPQPARAPQHRQAVHRSGPASHQGLLTD